MSSWPISIFHHTQSNNTYFSIFRILIKVISPILTFTADEAWSYATANVEYTQDSVHLQDWPVAPSEWSDPTLESDFAALLRVRAQVTEAIEPLRAAGHLGKSLDAAVTLTAGDDTTLAVLNRHREFLPELFIVSLVTIETTAAGSPLSVSVRPCADLGYVRCPRCWRWVPAVQSTPDGDLCPRCIQSLVS